MNWLNRKEEKIFQECLAAIQEKGDDPEEVLARYPEYASELRPRLATAVWLQGQGQDLAVSPGFLAASRRRLINRIALDTPAAILWPRLGLHRSAPRQRRLRYALNLAALLVLALSVFSLVHRTVSWAQTALPGDGVYLVKLLVEDMQLALTFDPVDQAKLRIDFAQERSNEIQELILEDRYEQIPISAVDFLSQVYQANQLLKIVEINDRASAAILSEKLNVIIDDQYTILNLLMDVVPAHARSAIEQAMIVAP